MGEVIPFKVPETVDFESIALEKIVVLSKVALQLSQKLDQSENGLDDQSRVCAEHHIATLTLIDDMLDWLESLAPHILDFMTPNRHEIFELDCLLTKLRMTVFASVRSSRLFISDFHLADLNESLCA